MADTVIKICSSIKRDLTDGSVAYDGFTIDIKPDAVSCLVTEERNGINEIKVKLLAKGTVPTSVYRKGYVIAATVNLGNDPNVAPVQHFDIYEVDKDDYFIYLRARHIFFRNDGFVVPPFRQTGVIVDVRRTYYLWDCVNGAFHEAAQLKNCTGLTNPAQEFSYGLIGHGNNVALIGKPYHNDSLNTLKKVLFDIADHFDAELCMDNFNVRAAADRGQDRGSIAKYGVNITKFNYQDTSDDVYNFIYFYWKNRVFNEEENIYEDKYTFVPTDKMSGSAFSFRKPYLYDMSSYWMANTQQMLVEQGSFMDKIRDSINNYGNVTYKINIADVLRSTEASSEEFADVNDIAICDTVYIDYAPQNIVNKPVKVVKTVFDVLKKRFDTIELGTVDVGFAKLISRIQDIQKEVNSATSSASNNIMTGSSASASVAGLEAKIDSLSSSIVNPVVPSRKYTSGELNNFTNTGVYYLYGPFTINGTSCSLDGVLYVVKDPNGETLIQMYFGRKTKPTIGIYAVDNYSVIVRRAYMSISDQSYSWSTLPINEVPLNDPYAASLVVATGDNLDNWVAPGLYEVWGSYTYSETVNSVTTTKTTNFYGSMEVKTAHDYIMQTITTLSSNSDSYIQYARRRRSNGEWGRWRKNEWGLM